MLRSDAYVSPCRTRTRRWLPAPGFRNSRLTADNFGPRGLWAPRAPTDELADLAERPHLPSTKWDTELRDGLELHIALSGLRVRIDTYSSHAAPPTLSPDLGVPRPVTSQTPRSTSVCTRSMSQRSGRWPLLGPPWILPGTEIWRRWPVGSSNVGGRGCRRQRSAIGFVNGLWIAGVYRRAARRF